MKPVLIDTDILSMFLRKHRKVVANDLVLVTNNEQHFQRVEGLQISNWAK